ncbi:MAG: nucleotide exchange factor GrpE [Actinomycetota bacterium]|nr:nucleotide exchange factor GrpE [Actinomycetota bacterium]
MTDARPDEPGPEPDRPEAPADAVGEPTAVPPEEEPEAAAAGPPPPPPTEADALRAALEEAAGLRDEYLDALLRARAEFDNYRKRTARERLQALDRGAEQLAGRLLGVLDSFGFALDAAEQSDDDRLAKGVRMVHDELVGVLRAAGLEEIDALGQAFDPEVHEAMLEEESPEPLDEPVVVDVLRPGYRFKDRVLRPATVKVAR